MVRVECFYFISSEVERDSPATPEVCKVTLMKPVATAPPYWFFTRQLYSPVSSRVRFNSSSFVSSSGGGESVEDWRCWT